MHRLRRFVPSANYLFTFEAAARRLSFTEAAQELNVSQPAVSKTIRLLEDMQGCAGATLTATALRAGINEMFRAMGTDWRCYGRYSAFHFLPDAPDAEADPADFPAGVFQRRSVEKLRMLRMALLLEGADLSSRGSGFVSAVHTEADSAQFLDFLGRAMRRLRAEGLA